MNRSDENSRTPLMYAVGSGWSHVVQLLLERGADTGSVDEHGSTALMHACSLGLPTIVRQLLDSRATVNDVCLVLGCLMIQLHLQQQQLCLRVP